MKRFMELKNKKVWSKGKKHGAGPHLLNFKKIQLLTISLQFFIISSNLSLLDLDRGGKMNPDPSGSGSRALHFLLPLLLWE